MNRFSPLFRQLVVVAGASLSAIMMFSASTATAATGEYYRAELASPVETQVEIIRGVAWRCEGTTCVADKAGSTAMHNCIRLQREIGQVVSFTVKDEALAAEDLAQCNEQD